ncbi:hypothetical protein Q8F55_004449 [Vanrija albida]|uniref:Uncharacterized protein n=1 Tax=Vanrija albida TaxID=181172 RepID=A0ABR3Q6S1_9TREE
MPPVRRNRADTSLTNAGPSSNLAALNDPANHGRGHRRAASAAPSAGPSTARRVSPRPAAAANAAGQSRRRTSRSRSANLPAPAAQPQPPPADGAAIPDVPPAGEVAALPAGGVDGGAVAPLPPVAEAVDEEVDELDDNDVDELVDELAGEPANHPAPPPAGEIAALPAGEVDAGHIAPLPPVDEAVDEEVDELDDDEPADNLAPPVLPPINALRGPRGLRGERGPAGPPGPPTLPAGLAAQFQTAQSAIAALEVRANDDGAHTNALRIRMEKVEDSLTVIADLRADIAGLIETNMEKDARIATLELQVTTLTTLANRLLNRLATAETKIDSHTDAIIDQAALIDQLADHS